MTRITNSDQVLAVIRNHLQRMAKSSKASSPGKASRTGQARMTSAERLSALNAIDGLNDEEFARGMVRSLLEDELGEKLGSSANFLEIVDRTAAIMQADPQTAALFRQLRKDL